MKHSLRRSPKAALTLSVAILMGSIASAHTEYVPMSAGAYGSQMAWAFVQFATSTSVYFSGYGGSIGHTSYGECVEWCQAGAIACGGSWAAGNGYFTEQG